MSTSREKDATQILLRIQAVPVEDPRVAWPINGDEFKAFLAEDRYIKPHDSEVARHAREWIGGEKSALAAVRALSHGIFQFMQGGSLIVETLDAPEILHCRQGKCSEYAILFASAARSAGIPTRLALGMRLLNGSWDGHLWNEAWVGRWITVDSTVDEVGNAPALLKLVDSDSVQGTQPLRWAATEALNVSVVGSAPELPAATRDLKTGIDGPVYTNAEFECRLTAPHADWTIENASAKGAPATVIRFNVPDHDDVFIHLVPMNVPAAFTPKALIQLRAARFKGMYKDFEIIKDVEHAAGRLHGRLFSFRRSGAKTEAAKMKTTEVLWTDGGSSYLLNLIASEKSHDEYAADFFKLLGSFESLHEGAESKPGE